MLSENKKRCFAIVLNDLNHNTRSRRALRLLAEQYQMTVFSLVNDPQLPYRSVVPNLPNLHPRLKRLFAIPLAIYHGCKTKHDTVFVVSLAGLLCGSCIKLIRGPLLIYDANELYAPDAGGSFSYSRLHFLLEKMLISLPDLILAANRSRAHLMKSTYHLETTPVDINNVYETLSTPANALPQEFDYLSLPTNRYIIYQGYLGALRSLDRFVQAMPHLPRDYHLTILAKGAGIEQIQQLIGSLGIQDRVHIHGFVHPSLLMAILRRCHLGIITYGMKGPNNNFCAPNKLFEYSQAQLPCITSPQQTFKDLFQKYPIGHYVPDTIWQDHDFSAIARLITELVENQPPKETFQRFNAEYDIEKEFSKFRSALQEIQERDQVLA